ncbi:MAG: methyl-accepting chemotaxis protein [Desulfobacterales bacterium]|nr:methyl-accepting chemotaxis protein [Desulfobacterales bacterium]
MKNISLGMKISLGFLILILIACFLGGAGVYNMRSVEQNSKLLADEYIPEVDIAVDLRGAANRLMYELRGYSFTEKKQFFDNAQKEFEAARIAIVKGRRLEENARYLTNLKKQLDVADKALSEYRQLADQTQETSLKMKENREILEQSAARYMKNCSTFLAGQKKRLQIELIEGQTRIQTITGLLDVSSSVRGIRFASGAKSQMVEILSLFEQAKSTLNELKNETMNEDETESLGGLSKTTEGFEGSIQNIIRVIDNGALVDAEADMYRKLIIKQAKAYEDACNGFLEVLHDKLTNDMFERTTKISIISDIIDTGNAIRIASFEAQAMRNPSVMEEAKKRFEDIVIGFGELKEITRSSTDLKRIKEVKSAGASYNKGMTDFLANWILLQEIGEKRSVAGKAVVTACVSLADAGMAATVTISTAAAESLSSASVSMIIGLVFALVIGVIAALLITKSITRPVGKTIANLTNVSEQVTSASGKVLTASQTLAEGASEQAASIEETSASLEEMSAMTKQNAASATEADKIVNNAGKIIETANGSMSQLTDSMTEITIASEETSKIIKTIDEIAFQTNLLALNAAVEAARAGDAGAGFAVVADEVRNLALRAAEAAKTTAELIEGTVQKVNDGAELVQKTSDAFSAVTESTNKVAGIIGEISDASADQSDGIEQINKTILDMDKVIQQGAASAIESASASEEMNGLTRIMKQAVDDLVRLTSGRKKRAVGSNTVLPRAEPSDQSNVIPASVGSLPVVPLTMKAHDKFTDNKDDSESGFF